MSEAQSCDTCVRHEQGVFNSVCTECTVTPTGDLSNWEEITMTSNPVEAALDTQVGGGHYKDMKIQPVVFIVENNIQYREANVIKYICRHAKKNGIEDVKKAMHYCQMIIDEYESRVRIGGSNAPR